MNKIFITLLIYLLGANIFSYGQTTESELTPTQKAYILSRFCTEVKYNFAFYDKLTFDWDSLCSASMSDLVSTPTDEEFVKGMKSLCAQLKDGHTFIVELNDPKNYDNWIKPFPMKTKRIGDRVFVTDVYSSVLQNSNVEPGCEILEIDGKNVLEYAATNLQPYLSSSTPQWTKYRPFAEFELTKDKMAKESGILFRDKKGKEFLIKKDRKTIPWDLTDNNSTLNFKILEGNVGLLTVSSFQDSDFNRSLFDEIYNEIFKTDALIIDIRDNGGGNSFHADYLISHFSDKPIPQGSWDSPMYIATHGSWNYPKEFYRESPNPLSPVKGKDLYQKPTVLLINATTFSSAENLCVSFRGAKRGKIIGTPTGGSTGNPIFINLGGGIACCICTKHELDAEGNEFIGIGIQPDIIVEEDLESFLKNKDNVIEKALEVIKREHI